MSAKYCTATFTGWPGMRCWRAAQFLVGITGIGDEDQAKAHALADVANGLDDFIAGGER